MDSYNLDKIALVSVAVALIAVFFPWIEATSSVSAMGMSHSSSSGGISGINFGLGKFALLICAAGGFMVYKQIKWAFIAGAANILISVLYMFGMVTPSGGNYSSSFGSASTSISPKWGLFLFAIASIVYVVRTVKDYRNQPTTN